MPRCRLQQLQLHVIVSRADVLDSPRPVMRHIDDLDRRRTRRRLHRPHIRQLATLRPPISVQIRSLQAEKPQVTVPQAFRATDRVSSQVSNLVCAKRRKDGGPDGRGVGFYFRKVTELILFGVRGSLRTLPPGRRQVNIIETRKREHSRKPDETYDVIQSCSPGPYLELFARYPRPGWAAWGDEADPAVTPRGRQWPAYGTGGAGRIGNKI